MKKLTLVSGASPRRGGKKPGAARGVAAFALAVVMALMLYALGHWALTDSDPIMRGFAALAFFGMYGGDRHTCRNWASQVVQVCTLANRKTKKAYMDVLTYQCDQSDYVVRGVPLAATRVSATGYESHPAITDKRATELFIQASIELSFATRADVADGIVEVTVEAREDCAGPCRVFVFLNNTDCIFFEPVLH